MILINLKKGQKNLLPHVHQLESLMLLGKHICEHKCIDVDTYCLISVLRATRKELNIEVFKQLTFLSARTKNISPVNHRLINSPPCQSRLLVRHLNCVMATFVVKLYILIDNF